MVSKPKHWPIHSIHSGPGCCVHKLSALCLCVCVHAKLPGSKWFELTQFGGMLGVKHRVPLAKGICVFKECY